MKIEPRAGIQRLSILGRSGTCHDTSKADELLFKIYAKLSTFSLRQLRLLKHKQFRSRREKTLPPMLRNRPVVTAGRPGDDVVADWLSFSVLSARRYFHQDQTTSPRDPDIIADTTTQISLILNSWILTKPSNLWILPFRSIFHEHSATRRLQSWIQISQQKQLYHAFFELLLVFLKFHSPSHFSRATGIAKLELYFPGYATGLTRAN